MGDEKRIAMGLAVRGMPKMECPRHVLPQDYSVYPNQEQMIRITTMRNKRGDAKVTVKIDNHPKYGYNIIVTKKPFTLFGLIKYAPFETRLQDALDDAEREKARFLEHERTRYRKIVDARGWWDEEVTNDIRK